MLCLFWSQSAPTSILSFAHHPCHLRARSPRRLPCLDAQALGQAPGCCFRRPAGCRCRCCHCESSTCTPGLKAAALWSSSLHSFSIGLPISAAAAWCVPDSAQLTLWPHTLRATTTPKPPSSSSSPAGVPHQSPAGGQLTRAAAARAVPGGAGPLRAALPGPQGLWRLLHVWQPEARAVGGPGRADRHLPG
jgi:hypothetical protein